MNDKRDKIVPVRLTRAEWDSYKKVAAKLGMSLSKLIRMALTEYVMEYGRGR